MKPTNIRAKGNPLVVLVKNEWQNLKDRKPLYAVYTFLFLLSVIVGLAEPLVIGLIFNSIQKSITTEAELWNLIWMISWLLFIEIIAWGLLWFSRTQERNTGYLVGKNLTDKKIKRLLDLPIAWHKDHHSGDTIDKINKSKNAITQFSMHTGSQVIRVIVNLFGSAIVIMFFDMKTALIALAFSFIILFIITRWDRVLVPLIKERNILENKAAAAIYDYISNIHTVITLRLKKVVAKEVEAKLHAPYPVTRKFSYLSETKWAFSGIAIRIMIVGLLSYSAYNEFQNTGTIMIGTLYILYELLYRMGHTFYDMGWLYGDLSKMAANIQNSENIDKAYKQVKGKIGGKMLGKEWKEIKLEGIGFTYDREGNRNHMNNINFEFKKGEKIALVGESGSGKSTLLALLRGLYEADKGKAFVNGKELPHKLNHLREYITLIPQDPEIFNNTIEFNVTMGIRYTKKEITKAIKQAQFEKVVKRLEKGIKTNVMEKGVSLSGGEKQRLALARGLLAAGRSEIVLMDEPTSSVDSVNEIKIHENIFKEFKGKTVISSIHRLHLLNMFDTIYYFEKGKMIAKGTLSEMKKHEKFKKLLEKYKNTKNNKK